MWGLDPFLAQVTLTVVDPLHIKRFLGTSALAPGAAS